MSLRTFEISRALRSAADYAMLFFMAKTHTIFFVDLKDFIMGQFRRPRISQRFIINSSRLQVGPVTAVDYATLLSITDKSAVTSVDLKFQTPR